MRYFKRLNHLIFPHRGRGWAMWIVLSGFCLLWPQPNAIQPNEFPPTVSERWGNLEVENLPVVNSYEHDYSPQISPDGRYLVFQSDRPGYLESHNLWISTNRNYQTPLEKANWTKPQPLALPLSVSFQEPTWQSTRVSERQSLATKPPFSVNTDNFEGAFSLHYHRHLLRELYFSSYRKSGVLGEDDRNGFSGLNIYYTASDNGRWERERHLNVVNSQFDDRMPTLSPQGDYMIFSSNRPGGYGGYDLWISRRDVQGNRWTMAVNAGGSINTSANESAPCLSPGGKLLFFSSNRPGGLGHYDLYMSRNQGKESWQVPKNLGEPFNSEHDDEYFSVTHDGDWVYFTSDRRVVGSKSGFNIYRTRLPQDLYYSVDVLFTGQVLDGFSRQKKGIKATIHILSEKENRVITSRALSNFKTEMTGPKNNFQIRLKSGSIYRVTFSSPGFIPKQIQLDYRGNLPKGKIDRHVIALQKINSDKPARDCYQEEAACLAKIKIYFASDQSTVSGYELPKILQVVRILKDNPSLQLQIEGHTDVIGKEGYNRGLAQRRARVVFNLLKENGIAAKRMSVHGYGFLRPAIKKKSKDEKVLRLNRRVEFHTSS